MITIESEIRTLREKLSNKSDDEEDFDENFVDDKPVAADESSSLSDVEVVNETSFPSTSTSPINDASTTFKSTNSSSDLSESDRKSLRRTRLQPRRFRQVATSPDLANLADLEAEDDQDEQDDEDETQREEKN